MSPIRSALKHETALWGIADTFRIQTPLKTHNGGCFFPTVGGGISELFPYGLHGPTFLARAELSSSGEKPLW